MTGKSQLANVLTKKDFHKPSGNTMDSHLQTTAKETKHLSAGSNSLSEYRPKAPSAKGKLGVV